jgi:hypothetical protein
MAINFLAAIVGYIRAYSVSLASNNNGETCKMIALFNILSR